MRAFPRTIAVLFHQNEKRRHLGSYAVTFLADFWRETGYRVVFLFGTRRFVPADLILVHVNLSIVADEYLEFAGRYPVALNGRIKDVRKSRVSTNLVGLANSYSGPAIVKADLNYCGYPEYLLGSRLSLRKRIARLFGRDGHRPSPPIDHRIYERLAQIPQAVFESRDLVVEKFLPEKEDDLFFVRHFEFLGDRWTCTRLASRGPIVKDETTLRIEEIEPHPEILSARTRLRFDYGKFDYVVHDGKAVLLDANKTVGADRVTTESLIARRRHRAEGIRCYLA